MASSLQSTIRDLHRRRGRERRGLALAEGVRLVEEILAAEMEISGAVLAPALENTTRGQALAATLVTSGIPVERVDDRSMAALADTEHPQGIIVVFRPRAWRFADFGPAPVLVLDAVQDPGNVGTMLRTADALGAGGVVALPGTADLTNPKVVRGGMGASFRLPALHASGGDLAGWLGESERTLWIAEADGEPVGEGGIPGSLALVVGNEGAGVQSDIAALAARRIGIRLRTGAESLNVAVAAGILLYEVMRGR